MNRNLTTPFAALVLTLLWPQGIWHAYLVAGGLAAGNTFFNPAAQAVVPALTTEGQRLAANSVAWSTGRLVQILASVVAGGLIALIGPGPAFALNAASFVASAALVATLRIPPHPRQLGASPKSGLGSYLSEARAGLSFVRRDRFVARLLPVQALASLATGGTSASWLCSRSGTWAGAGWLRLAGRCHRRRRSAGPTDPECAGQGLP